MTENLPDKIRGHHLPLLVRNLTLEEFAAICVIDKYVDSPSHYFVNYVHSTLSALLQNPEHKIKIIAGTKDFICENCPKEECCSKSLWATGEMAWFLDEHFLQEPIEIDKEYTVREICNAINIDKWCQEHKIKEKLKHLRSNYQ